MDDHLKYVKGDLVAMVNDFDVVMHGCNCHHVMGAGVAAALARAYPQVLDADRARTRMGDRGKMGTYSKASVGGTLVLNCYTQYDYSRGGRNFDYEAFARVLESVKKEYAGKKIGLPMIGSGLAGGDWGIISVMINNILCGEDVTIVQL